MQPSETTAMSDGARALATITAPAPLLGKAASLACTASGPPERMSSRERLQTSAAETAPFVFSSTHEGRCDER